MKSLSETIGELLQEKPDKKRIKPKQKYQELRELKRKRG